jgi:hypothetical protein
VLIHEAGDPLLEGLDLGRGIEVHYLDPTTPRPARL